MIPQTIGKKFNIGKVVPVKCVRDVNFKDIDIKGHCFLMLIVREGSTYFQVGDIVFEAIAPCFVCFDERVQPKLIRKREFKCDAVYFHPTFLNVNMTFDLVHSDGYEQVATIHDLFLLKPFTDEKRYVFPFFEEYTDNLNRLFNSLENELEVQSDWYWSCRSRSFFIEIILMLERAYGIVGEDVSSTSINNINNPYLKNAVTFIESNYQKHITLDSITKAVSINHSTLTRLFKEELGVTPIEYLWQYRITVAKKHLEFTNLPVKYISVRCGFKTIQHFSRKFEKYTNNTPTTFRKLAVAKRKATL